jgi:hypothetical protein
MCVGVGLGNFRAAMVVSTALGCGAARSMRLCGWPRCQRIACSIDNSGAPTTLRHRMPALTNLKSMSHQIR